MNFEKSASGSHLLYNKAISNLLPQGERYEGHAFRGRGIGGDQVTSAAAEETECRAQ